MSLVKIGDSQSFGYTGNIQSIILNPGNYKLELWGAQGSNIYAAGGLGGYSCGELSIRKQTTIYVCIGQYPNTYAGGYNGGGFGSTAGASSMVYTSPGGGASHIALSNRGLLKEYKDHVEDLLLVAGGGGGSARYCGGIPGGSGGGLEGGKCYFNNYTAWGQVYQTACYPPNQLNSGTLIRECNNYILGSYGFGFGGQACGGGFYGGFSIGAVNRVYSGFGGSGYISSKLTNASSKNGVRKGHGYAIITLISIPFFINATYDEGFEKVIFSPENYSITDKITVTPVIKPGYDWVEWTGDINSTTQTLVIEGLTKDVSIHASSKPGSAKYKINYYLMKINGSEYELEESETYNSITGTVISCPVKTYRGFQSPSQQTITVKNDSTSVVNYYYIRNKYRITVQNGTSLKYEYWYQETGTLSFDKNSTPALKIFKCWYSDKQATILGALKKEAKFLMPDYDVNFIVIFEDYTRLNSNIYKNIFPEEVFDLGYIESLKENTLRTYNEIKQFNHGFQVNDVLAYDSQKGYFKPIASSDTKNIRGIVSDVRNVNVFTIMSEGQLPYIPLNFTDTTILYLSDKIPGRLVHYKEIENTVYIPVAIYTNDSIIINILDGAYGAPLIPYEQPNTTENLQHYTQNELQEIIDAVIGG